MATKKELERMTETELVGLCINQGIEYHDGNEILDADALRAKLTKAKAD